MSKVYETILDQALMALENLQSLNAMDVEKIHEIADHELLETCARQLAKLAKPLEKYRSDLIGTSTHLGLIVGIRKNNKRQITEYKIINSTGNHWLTTSEYNERIKQAPLANISAFDQESI